MLIRYPWDWSPDEGLFLDYARRLVETPGLLYTRSYVPLPLAYGPLYPAVLAPVVAHSASPLAGARMVALVSALLGALAIGFLVRPRAGALLALACAALHLALFDLSFWYLLVRVDGLMITLWLLAAVALLPRELRRGSDRLSPLRLAAGVALLLAAVLTKPTAVLHGAPLVVGWWWIDRRSAVRLGAGLVTAGLAVVGILQWATSGGFLWAYGALLGNPRVPGLATRIVLDVGAAAAPVVLLAAVGALLAHRAGAHPFRDGRVLLLAGGLLILPTLGKFGATHNYLLPALAATVVCAGGWWASAAPRFSAWGLGLGSLVVTALALALALTREFPLPNSEDERTARAFYEFVQAAQRDARDPLLASRPEYAYFLTHQPVELEASGFPDLLARHAPGTEEVIDRLREGRYGLLIWTWPWTFPVTPPVVEAMAARYQYLGRCGLRWYFGRLDTHLALRKDIDRRFEPPADSRCVSARALSQSVPPGIDPGH